MITPQEVNVWYILPALRKELAVCLKEKGMKQKQIAHALGVTESAVSQYIKSKRAQTITLPEDLRKEVDRAAENIIHDRSCHIYELQNLLDIIRNSGFLCKVHRTKDKVPECCNVCIKKDKEELRCGST